VRTTRAGQAALRTRLAAACAAAVRKSLAAD
jgi:hypothetical protein